MGLLKRLFGLEPIVQAIEQGGTEISEQLSVLNLEKIAIQTAIGYIASAVSQCEFRTFLNGTEVREQEYYRWNYSPNKNQNSSVEQYTVFTLSVNLSPLQFFWKPIHPPMSWLFLLLC